MTRKASNRSRAIMANKDGIKEHQRTLVAQAEKVHQVIRVLDQQNTRINKLEKRIASLELPFYKRWFRRKKGAVGGTDTRRVQGSKKKGDRGDGLDPHPEHETLRVQPKADVSEARDGS